jgi:hypothetical protein
VFAVKEVYVLRVANLADLAPERNRMSPTLIKKVRTFSEKAHEAPVVVRGACARGGFGMRYALVCICARGGFGMRYALVCIVCLGWGVCA